MFFMTAFSHHKVFESRLIACLVLQGTKIKSPLRVYVSVGEECDLYNLNMVFLFLPAPPVHMDSEPRKLAQLNSLNASTAARLPFQLLFSSILALFVFSCSPSKFI